MRPRRLLGRRVPRPYARPSPGRALGAVALALALLALPTHREALDTPSLQLVRVLSGLEQPVFVADPNDGTSRLFVVERRGTIRVAVNGQLQPTPFLDITRLVESGFIEQGLLGMAFHPGYASNGVFYVAYTGVDHTDKVVRYAASAADPDEADPTSGRVLLSIPDAYANHNGGMLLFGPDGYLYVGTGDGGGLGDPQGNAQNPSSLLGKMLRLDVDHGAPYAIPPDNPLVGVSGARAEIWALGLRNPWRYSFDRATHDLYLGDVGEQQYEEIDRQPAGSRGGENYGWNRLEGVHCFPRATSCDRSGLTLPIFEYPHSQGCAVVGGYVYRGTAVPTLDGTYFYSDNCSGTLWSLTRDNGDTWTSETVLNTGMQVSSFGEDQRGELYLADLGSGAVYRLAGAASERR